MKKLVILVALLALPHAAAALPALSFDTTPGGAGGTLTYDGAGGPLEGRDIIFVDIFGIDTPANSGVLLTCEGCSLDFNTGLNTLEGPPQYTWDGGGAFVLTGAVPALGIPADTLLLSGTFTGTPNTPGLAAAGTSALFIAVGVDVKNPTLTAFYGLGPTEWTFADTAIALGTLVLDPATGGFTAVPQQADLVNIKGVPLPASGLLLGLGALGIGVARRKA